MFEMDRQLSKVASNIEIPQDFVKNDTMKTNSFDQMLIEKMDGQSVNNISNILKFTVFNFQYHSITPL